MEKFDLKRHYTNKIVNDLLKIDKAREVVSLLELPVSIEEEIKKETTVKRVHYSTKIEGNSLNLSEVKEALNNNKESHERNVREVRSYYNALMYLNEEAEKGDKITKDMILKVHNLVVGKKLNSKSSFRDGQNVVQDSETGTIVYMPPEAKDVDSLLEQSLKEINKKDDIPIPIKAGIFVYEFVTVHPFYDGNGRSARLFATYILKKYGYDLKGFYVMEEFYDRNIYEYYDSLQMGLHHNFYFGRNSADITPWIEYFIGIMADTFDAVRKRVEEIYNNSKNSISAMDMLDKRERWVANFILNNKTIKAKDIAHRFKINNDTANNWIKKWIEKDFLRKNDDKQIRNIDYTLTDKYLKKLK